MPRSAAALPSIATWPDPVALADRAAVRRFGLILLATDLTTERDVARLLPREGTAVHATRVAFCNPTTADNLRAMAPHLEAAAGLLVPDAPLAAICYACTSASVVIGDAAVRETIARVRPGVPVVTPTGAARRALATLGAGRIALLTPYLAETTRPVAEHFAAHGFDVVKATCLGLDDDRDMARVPAKTIVAAALAADSPEAEALFVSCTALPALEVVDAIEARIGKPVVSSNQASIWEMLHLAGLPAAPRGYGRLFDTAPAEPDGALPA
jgi:maleate isomerase